MSIFLSKYILHIFTFPADTTPCSEGDIRLAEQTHSTIDDDFFYGGRVDVCYNDVYHPVCDVGWDDMEAAVICNYYNYGTPSYRILASFTPYST